MLLSMIDTSWEIRGKSGRGSKFHRGTLSECQSFTMAGSGDWVCAFLRRKRHPHQHPTDDWRRPWMPPVYEGGGEGKVEGMWWRRCGCERIGWREWKGFDDQLPLKQFAEYWTLFSFNPGSANASILFLSLSLSLSHTLSHTLSPPLFPPNWSSFISRGN